jgi:gluconokinase
MNLNSDLVINPETRLRIVVMGVSGAGKSVVGKQVASLAGLRFIEGDDFHSTISKEKLAKGIPLSDLDRAPWLEELSRHIREIENSGGQFVLACSALKRSYRDILRRGMPNLIFIQLNGKKDTIAARLSARLGHFASANILDSQFKDLENLEQDEIGISMRIEKPPEILSEEIVRYALNESSERLWSVCDSLSGVGLDG